MTLESVHSKYVRETFKPTVQPILSCHFWHLPSFTETTPTSILSKVELCSAVVFHSTVETLECSSHKIGGDARTLLSSWTNGRPHPVPPSPSITLSNCSSSPTTKEDDNFPMNEIHSNLPSSSTTPPPDSPRQLPPVICTHGAEDELSPFELVRHCCESFDDDGEPVNDFPHCLFMVGEWLMENNTELMAQFVALYKEDFDTFAERVCYAVGFWIRNFPVNFDENSQLCRLVERLKKMAIEDQLPDYVFHDLDISSIPSYAWLRNVSVRNPVSRHVSLSFDQWSPADISTSMSHIDYKVLSRVTIPEIKKYVKLTKLHQTPILERSIAVFNSLSSWIQCMILSKSTPSERAAIISKFVNVGKHLRKLANFNTLYAVIGGVSHSNISRLSKTQACLSQETRKDLNMLTNLLSNSNNFCSYRRALQEVKGFRIPIMGIHLKDLIAWAGGQNFDKTRRISERRLFQLGQLLSYFLGANRSAHNFPEANMDLINTLKVSLDIVYNEEDIYALSLKREPRTLLNFQNSKPVIFAEWAAGISQTPDPETVNKHISAMVEAVFKHYDHDRDGVISRDEFEQIACNFPFIDSFGAIDADRDGQISKSEMMNYFKNFNKHSLEIRRGFKHNFHETTFITPAYCGHCNKLVFFNLSCAQLTSSFQLWGLIRQGFKCKDCGFIAHRRPCKDDAVAECRKRRNQSGFGSWLMSSPKPTSISTIVLPENEVTDESNERNQLTTRKPKKGLFITNRSSKNRTVSTVSESQSPEPPHSAGYVRKTAPVSCQPNLVAQNSTTSTSSGGVNGVLDTVLSSGNTLRSSFHRFIRPRKNRTTTSSPDPLHFDRDSAIASLATEEVFEDDSSRHSSTASINQNSVDVSAPNTTRSHQPVRRNGNDGSTTVR
ncbi:hypothetical protein M3Y95_00186900 [Aphelenchoides besseyi]|nr:hypothetical protein M3Y95_00186900 [Aphelenchoides besseyi]